MNTKMLIEIQNWIIKHNNYYENRESTLTIKNIVNPGWFIKLSMDNIPPNMIEYIPTNRENSEYDWIHFELDGSAIVVRCGPHMLNEALSEVKNFANRLQQEEESGKIPFKGQDG